MDDKTSSHGRTAENHVKSSSTSESSEYELVENSSPVENPVVSNNVSEDLINDAIESSELNSPTAAANMMVGKSIFYDCNDKTNSDTDDEGFYFQNPLLSALYIFSCVRRCTDL